MKVSSLHLDDKKPFVTIIGKGNKLRNVPLTDKTVAHLKKYIEKFHKETFKDEYLFYSMLDNKPHQLSTDSISLILKKAADIAREKCDKVPDNVHCHLFRKTKAMDLYKNGVPLPFIMQLLGLFLNARLTVAILTPSSCARSFNEVLCLFTSILF